MKTFKLKELLLIKNGKDHKDLNNGNIPIFGSGGIMRYGDKAIYNEESILLPRKGTLSNIQYVDSPFWTVDTIYYSIINKELVNPFYLFNFLKLLDLSKLNTGTGVPSMTFDSYYNLDIVLPKIETQQKIASILSSLEAKIRINNKISIELEAMARTLYGYWFVQFNFPDENGKPYKSNNGKMVYEEKLKRDIPEGWNVTQLDDVISRSGTGLNPRDNFKLGYGKNYYITIKNVKNGKIVFDDNCDRIDDESLKIINKRSDLQVGDILFTSIEPVGVTYYIHEKPTNWNINESVFTIRANYDKITSEYLYMLLSSSELKSFTSNSSTGSIHKGIRHGVLKTFIFPYKDKTITEEFSKVIIPLLKRINVIDSENQKLAELRDWLLPMLMNGQVKTKG